jgi:hypothetical protein
MLTRLLVKRCLIHSFLPMEARVRGAQMSVADSAMDSTSSATGPVDSMNSSSGSSIAAAATAAASAAAGAASSAAAQVQSCWRDMPRVPPPPRARWLIG